MIDQSIHQSAINQSVNQSINQSINQLLNVEAWHTTTLTFSLAKILSEDEYYVKAGLAEASQNWDAYLLCCYAAHRDHNVQLLLDEAFFLHTAFVQRKLRMLAHSGFVATPPIMEELRCFTELIGDSMLIEQVHNRVKRKQKDVQNHEMSTPDVYHELTLGKVFEQRTLNSLELPDKAWAESKPIDGQTWHRIYKSTHVQPPAEAKNVTKKAKRKGYLTRNPTSSRGAVAAWNSIRFHIFK